MLKPVLAKTNSFPNKAYNKVAFPEPALSHKINLFFFASNFSFSLK